MKYCSHCGNKKPEGEFYWNSRDGVYGSYCKECHKITVEEARQRRINTDGVRERATVALNSRVQKLKRFGLTIDKYNEMYTAQCGLCAICGQTEKSTRNGVPILLSVDHNHTTGEVRALLCTTCNTGIGSLQDSPELLEAAAKYLREYA